MLAVARTRPKAVKRPSSRTNRACHMRYWARGHLRPLRIVQVDHGNLEAGTGQHAGRALRRSGREAAHDNRGTHRRGGPHGDPARQRQPSPRRRLPQTSRPTAPRYAEHHQQRRHHPRPAGQQHQPRHSSQIGGGEQHVVRRPRGYTVRRRQHEQTRARQGGDHVRRRAQRGPQPPPLNRVPCHAGSCIKPPPARRAPAAPAAITFEPILARRAGRPRFPAIVGAGRRTGATRSANAITPAPSGGAADRRADPDLVIGCRHRTRKSILCSHVHKYLSRK
jgi:hypothetical protein